MQHVFPKQLQYFLQPIEHQHQELLIIDAIKNEYKKHLEQVIVYHSVENYRDTVRKNREVAVTTPQKN